MNRVTIAGFLTTAMFALLARVALGQAIEIVGGQPHAVVPSQVVQQPDGQWLLETERVPIPAGRDARQLVPASVPVKCVDANGNVRAGIAFSNTDANVRWRLRPVAVEFADGTFKLVTMPGQLLTSHGELPPGVMIDTLGPRQIPIRASAQAQPPLVNRAPGWTINYAPNVAEFIAAFPNENPATMEAALQLADSTLETIFASSIGNVNIQIRFVPVPGPAGGRTVAAAVGFAPAQAIGQMINVAEALEEPFAEVVVYEQLPTTGISDQ
ncbi:MAG: hypothetical protein IT438_00080 [Phycisphaerales bacterium]|nr:hypothetical protein [Phycisphaerales bacterium]